MGVESMWFSCFINDNEYERIVPHFWEANKRAFLSKEQEAAIEFWREQPLEIDWMNYDIGSRVNEFLCAFNLPGFDQLAESFCFNDGAFCDIMSEESTFRFIMTNRNTPVSLLWHALRYERAIQLPGKMGNLFVHREEVGLTLEKVQLVFADLNMAELKEKAKLFSGQEVDDDIIHDIMTMLPEGLTKALEMKKGIIFLATQQF